MLRSPARPTAFDAWRDVPAPRRGELVRLLGEELRSEKDALGALVTLEAGKIIAGGPRRGAGDDRHLRLRGRSLAPALRPHDRSERPGPSHDGEVASARRRSASSRAFNFPVAVWAWNAVLALVCGDPVVWKPSEKTPLTALACQALFARAARALRRRARGLLELVDRRPRRRRAAGRRSRVPLVWRPARRAWAGALAPRVAARFGRSLLELGGNNAMIVAPSRRSRARRPRAIALRRRRHGRSALHDAAAADRARERSPTSSCRG